MQISGVVIADRSGYPTLGMPAARIGCVAFGQHQYAGPAIGGGERCRQPGRAGPDDEEIE
jgi:hypothetical protein